MNNFHELVVSADVPVILDAWAPWCGPCKALTPIIEAEVLKHEGAVRLAKLNTDENAAIAQQLRVQALPTVYGLAGGKLVGQFVGMKTAEEIAKFVLDVKAAGSAAPKTSLEADASPSSGAEIELPTDPSELLAFGARCLDLDRVADAKRAFSAALDMEVPLAAEQKKRPPLRSGGIVGGADGVSGHSVPPGRPEEVEAAEVGSRAIAGLALCALSAGEASMGAHVSTRQHFFHSCFLTRLVSGLFAPCMLRRKCMSMLCVGGDQWAARVEHLSRRNNELSVTKRTMPQNARR
jgi:thioredoxin